MSFYEAYQKDLMYLMVDRVMTFHIKEWSLGHYCISSISDYPEIFNVEIQFEIADLTLFVRKWPMIILER